MLVHMKNTVSSLYIYRVHRNPINKVILLLKNYFILANSVYSDRMPYFVPLHRCLHCLSKYLLQNAPLEYFQIRSFLSMQYVHSDLCKHPDRYSNLFLNAYINRHKHAKYLKMI